MWSVLLAHALAAPAAANWADAPVARGLHPVSWDPFASYHAALEEVMGSPRASPSFSAVVSTADVHWRLVEATGVGLRLGPDAPGQWQDYALAGSLLAIDRVVGEVAGRSEEVDAVRTALDLFVDPSAELVIRRDGRVTLDHQAGGAARRWVRRRETGEGLGVARGPSRTPPIRIGLSAGWTLRDPDAPPDDPLVGWAVQLDVRNAGLTLWHVDVDLLELRWVATARQRLWEDLSLGAGLRSDAGDPAPSRWTAGFYWTPRPQVVLSTTWSQPLAHDGWRVDAGVRVELGSFLPGRLRPALAPFPTVPDRAPNPVAAWRR